jgi:hypothetical protein
MSNERIPVAKPATFNWRFWSAAIPVLLVQLGLVYGTAGWDEPAPPVANYQEVAPAPERLPRTAAVAVAVMTPELEPTGAAPDAAEAP